MKAPRDKQRRDCEAVHDIDWHAAPVARNRSSIGGVMIAASDGESRLIAVGEMILVKAARATCRSTSRARFGIRREGRSSRRAFGRSAKVDSC